MNHDEKGWAPSSITFSQIEGIEPTDDLDRLYSFVDFGQRSGKREEEYDDFALVDNKLQSKTKILSRHGLFQPKIGPASKTRQSNNTRTTTVQRVVTKRTYREQTVAIKSGWSIVAELSKQNNEKMNFDPNAPEDIAQFGKILAYKTSQDSAFTTNTPKNLNTKCKNTLFTIYNNILQ